MGPHGGRDRSSRPTGTPTSTRSRRCSPRGASTRTPSSASRARSTGTCASSTACTRTSWPRRARRALELDAIRRLIVVETTHASRLGELEPRRARPRGREGRLRPPRGRAARTGRGAEHTILSEDGALTTTLVGILAEREIAVDAARGDRVRARHPRGHGLAHLPDGDAARRGGARVVPPPRRAPGAARAVPPHAARPRTSGSCSARCIAELRAARGRRRRGARRRAQRGRATSTGSRTSRTRSSTSPTRRRSCCSSRWTSGSSASRAAARPSSTPPRWRGLLGGGGHPAGGLGDLQGSLEQARRTAARERFRARAGACAAAEIMSSPPARSAPDETVAQALVACQRLRPERDPRSPRTGRLGGVVGREDLDRADRARLSHAPVKGIMSAPRRHLRRGHVRSPSSSGLLAGRRRAASPSCGTSGSSASSRAATCSARSASQARRRARRARC